MNRKYLYIFCSVGLLLVALVVAMLLGSAGNGTSATGKTTVGIGDTTEQTVQGSVVQDQSSSEQRQPVGETEPMPSFDVELGVGGELVFEETTEAPDEQEPTVTAPTATIQPTTDQNTETTEASQTPNSESTQTTPSADGESDVGDDGVSGGETETPDEQEPTVTAPTETTQPTTDQNTEPTDATQPSDTESSGMPSELLTYEEFLALTPAEQQAYFFLFEDPLDYARWMQKAQQEYEDGQTSIIVTGPVDLSTLPTGGN